MRLLLEHRSCERQLARLLSLEPPTLRKAEGEMLKSEAGFSGDLAYTGSLINASDAKLKEDIQPMDGALEKVMQLQPRTFKFKHDGEAAQMSLPRVRNTA